MIDKGSYYIYIPQNCSNSTDAVIYYPGADGARGSGYDSSAIENYARNNPDQIIIVNKKCSENTDNIYGALRQIQAQRSFNIRNVNILSHSAGQSSAFNTAGKANNYGLNVKYVGVLDSAYDLSNVNISDAEAKSLAASGSTVLVFDQDNEGRINSTAGSSQYLGSLIRNGVPIVYVKCNTGSDDWGYNHQVVNSVPVQNGLIPLMSGEISSMSTNGAINSYEYWTYDYKTNGWVRITKEQAEKLLSDSDYITASLTNIISQINGSTLENQLTINLPHGSNTKSPSINKETYDILSASLANLCAKAKAELMAFINAGQEYDKTDHMLSQKAAELTNSFMNGPTSAASDIPPLDAEVAAKLKEYEPREVPKYDTETFYNQKLTESVMELTAADFDRLFEKWAKDQSNPDSPLLGTGELFVKAAAAAGIDVLALVALCGKETGYGSKSAMDEMNQNNFFGSLINDGDFTTKEEGITEAAKAIKDCYMGAGGMVKDLDYSVNGNGTYGKEVAQIMNDSLDYILESDPREHITPKDEDEEDEGKDNPKKNTSPVTNTPTYQGGNNYNGGDNNQQPQNNNNNTTNNNNNEEPAENEEPTPEEQVQEENNQQAAPVEENIQPAPASNNVAPSAPAASSQPAPEEPEEPIEDTVKDDKIDNVKDKEYDDPFTDDYEDYFKTKDTTSEIDTTKPTEETQIGEPTETNQENKKHGNGLITAIGATLATGAAAGAVAYNMKRSKENNEISDEPTDSEEELEIESDE